MNKHLSKKQLIALAAERVSPAQENSYRTHIGSCPQCRDILEKMQRSQDPYYRWQVSLSPQMKTRILRSIDAAAASEAGRKSHNSRRRALSWALVPAAAAVVLILSFVLLRSPLSNETLGPFIFRTKGNVTVNGVQAVDKTILGEGAHLLFDREAQAEITGRGHRLSFMGPADMRIEGAFASTIWRHITYRYRINRGIMVSVKDPAERRLRLRYTTPYGTLYSTGTRFMLDLDGSGAIVYLFTGKLTMTGPTGEGPMKLEPGMRYKLPDLTREGPITEADVKMADAIEAVLWMGTEKAPGVRGDVRKDNFNYLGGDQKDKDAGTPDKHLDSQKTDRPARDLKHESLRERRDLNRDVKKDGRNFRQRERPGRN